ncbi:MULTISPECIES: GNAT family N-acetyltransferase [Thermocrispum]|jgi:RimJ/RimL family protein N-acetyltransferase|uniref:GNAT family N-acetyltransferase n=1 Tax=Thermocrispum agreste TaxID=37925 RepID=A0A2W4K2W0_9PSEU|nr:MULTISPECIES: GNAT family N-acetyltransferase [Thermocrispum]PZN00558.1 MAG: GNAT family N-acetyltransferase [Thermocrispum agreste]
MPKPPENWLRAWRMDDAPMLLAAAQEPSLQQQFVQPISSLDEAEKWIQDRGADSAAGTAHAWAICGENDEALGLVTVSHIEPRHSTGWVAYWLLPQARGKGLAVRSVRAISRWAFDELGLFRLELGHRVDNTASCRVARAAGYAAEGIERSRLRYGDKRYDVERHARLATDPEPGEVTGRNGFPGRS